MEGFQGMEGRGEGRADMKDRYGRRGEVSGVNVLRDYALYNFAACLKLGSNNDVTFRVCDEGAFSEGGGAYAALHHFRIYATDG